MGSVGALEPDHLDVQRNAREKVSQRLKKGIPTSYLSD